MSMALHCVIIRWWFVIFIPAGLLCASKTFNYGSTTSAISGHVCPSSDKLQDINLESDLQCSYVCASDEACDSFFYHHDESKCVLCNSVYFETSNLVPYPGMSYYIREDVMAIFRRWTPWTSWSSCTRTCSQGIRERTRTCNSTARCSGESFQREDCNYYACAPIASTCADWASRGFDETREMVIDPDGIGSDFGNVTVSCDLQSEPSKAITVLHHDYENQFGYQGVSCAAEETILTYTVGFETAKKIVDISTACRQYLKWECTRNSDDWESTTRTCAGWTNRSMERSSYLTGPYPSGKYCHCGERGDCLDPMLECNCDIGGSVSTSDEGYITKKDDLPINSFIAGDTGNKYGCWSTHDWTASLLVNHGPTYPYKCLYML